MTAETENPTSYAGKVLRGFAEHFEQRAWDYTRTTHIKQIRYDNTPEDELWGRIKRAAHWLFTKQPTFAKGWGPNRFYMAWYVLKRESHEPDGVLDGGNIMVYWEETAEYLQYVQPSVGSKIADFLEQEPEHPHAIEIGAEITRIMERYGMRIDAGEVDGRKVYTKTET